MLRPKLRLPSCLDRDVALHKLNFTLCSSHVNTFLVHCNMAAMLSKLAAGARPRNPKLAVAKSGLCSIMCCYKTTIMSASISLHGLGRLINRSGLSARSAGRRNLIATGHGAIKQTTVCLSWSNDATCFSPGSPVGDTRAYRRRRTRGARHSSS